MEELMHEMNPWWEEKFDFVGIKREKYFSSLKTNFANKDVIFLTGLRRVGKTTLIKQFIYHLINERKINPKKICYLSLDAYLFDKVSISELVREFRKINRIGIREKIYLFFDEVTYKENFSREFKNLYDISNVKIYATSSSSLTLADKRAYLTGRSRLIVVEPLDFEEFLIFRKYKVKKSEKYLLDKYFREYMEYGGMPEYVLTKDPNYITNLVDNIISKDIIAYHNIKEKQTIKDLFRLLCERVGKPMSYNKLGNVLGISKDTVKKFIGYFVESFLFYIVEKDSRSLNERIGDLKKIYIGDVGIKNVTVGFRDLSAIYENLVFLKIKKNEPFYYKKDGIEIDFKFKEFLIEAKYGQKLEGKQKKVFEKLKVKNKIITNGVDFFIDDVIAAKKSIGNSGKLGNMSGYE